jgi:hypothetical protein
MFADELANAQMLSDRGSFGEARQTCQLLLRDYPSSADAHAAMGDTYATEGRWSDAIKWYELALELDFDPGVMEKLASARGHAIRSGSGAVAGPQVAVPRREAPVVEDDDRGRKRQLVGLVALGVILVTVIAFLVFRPGQGQPETDQPGPERASAQPSSSSPLAAQGLRGGPAMAGAAAAQPASGTPGSGAAAPPAGETAGTRYTGQPPVSSGPAKRPRPDQTEVPIAELYSGIEQHVLGQMQLSKWREGTSMSNNVSLALDDLTGSGIMTVRAPRTTDPDRLERDVLTSAYRASAAALRADSSLREMVVRCVVRLPNEQGEDENYVVFRCKATRESLGQWIAGDPMPTIERLRSGLLGQVWWDRETLKRYIEGRRAASEGGQGTGGAPGGANP